MATEEREFGYMLTEWNGKKLTKTERQANTFLVTSERNVQTVLAGIKASPHAKAVAVMRKKIVTDWEEVTDAE